MFNKQLAILGDTLIRIIGLLSIFADRQMPISFVRHPSRNNCRRKLLTPADFQCALKIFPTKAKTRVDQDDEPENPDLIDGI